MKTFLSFLFVVALAATCPAPPPAKNTSMEKPGPTPPTIAKAPLQPMATDKIYSYEQKPAVTGQPVLVTPEQAKVVMDKFKDAYGKLDRPRILMVVNRDPVDRATGLTLASRRETFDVDERRANSNFEADPKFAGQANRQPATISAEGDVTIRGSLGSDAQQLPGKRSESSSSRKGKVSNIYNNRKPAAFSLTDRQTLRDIERLFGRPLRHGGARLADQRMATQLIPDFPLKDYSVPTEGSQAYKDRKALAQISDVVLEILVSSRDIIVPGISGNRTYTLPDIQATAIRLSDSRILGQASSSDVIGHDRYAGNIARNFDIRDIAEATALALMEDMTVGVE